MNESLRQSIYSTVGAAIGAILVIWLFSSCDILRVTPAYWFANVSAVTPCPVQGDATRPEEITLNKFKNRTETPVLPRQLDFGGLLYPGDDRTRYRNEQSAVLTGYVAKVKDGGLETCNCHSAVNKDTHIILVADPRDAGTPMRHVIVEVTPHFRSQFGTTDTIRRKYLHKMVTFTGWMMFDVEHVDNAFNTNPGNKKDWRATCWELHPVVKMELASTIDQGP